MDAHVDSAAKEVTGSLIPDVRFFAKVVATSATTPEQHPVPLRPREICDPVNVSIAPWKCGNSGSQTSATWRMLKRFLPTFADFCSVWSGCYEMELQLR